MCFTTLAKRLAQPSRKPEWTELPTAIASKTSLNPEANHLPQFVSYRLRQIHVESVDLLGADVAGEQRRVVGSQAQPRHYRSSGHSPNVLFLHYVFHAPIAYLNTQDTRGIAPSEIFCFAKIHVLSILRPARIAISRARHFRPLLCRSIKKHQPKWPRRSQSHDVSSIRGDSWGK